MMLLEDAVPIEIETTEKIEKDKKGKPRSERAKAREDRKRFQEERNQQERKQYQEDAEQSVSEDLLGPEEGLDVSVSVGKTLNDSSVQVNTEEMDRLFEGRTRNVLEIKSNEQLTAWSGISNFKMLEVFEKAVKMVPYATFLERWDISVRHLILLVCIKLKTDMSFRCISTLFDVTPKTASKYFRGFVPLLADVMRVAVPWQDGDLLKKDLPYHFRQFQNVRAVLDCTEVQLQRSTCLHCRILTYSHYKGRETVKFLVSVTPGGVFNYVSQGFVGKASDKFIFNASGMITMFDEGDAIMVDKGFAISNELSQHRLEMIRPPLLQGEQLSTEEAKQNASIARARVHVERAIQRLKNFNIFTNKFELNLVPFIDDLIIIAAGITNLSDPILADSRF